ncbi:HEPN domain-containing protein [Azospirillum sp. CT11-132]|uniref:HEPN domain-containing protein n=1 Tax=Azospirillum sp. CT11-132 TaxID=3396317 RepID=UPI0039A5D914
MTGTIDPLARLGRAEEALNAAKLLYSGGFPRDCVNRAHLAMELAALAILTRYGFGSKSHRGVQALFFEHVAKPGLMPMEHAQALAAALRDRLLTDYEEPAADVTRERAAKHLANAEHFLGDVRSLLTAAS